jgi:hypothetical protein
MGVMFDGVVPSAGSSSSEFQYDTFLKNEKPESVYAGIIFDRSYDISGVDFTEGKHFNDGGWFASAPYVEVLVNGVWERVTTKISKAYPENNLKAQGTSYETYTFEFSSEIKCDGVRICGVPGGSACFISVGEIAPISKTKNDFENNSVTIPICNVSVPEGSGSKDIFVICDGIAGTNAKSQYDTYVKNPAQGETYVGYIYSSDETVKAVEFTEGMHFDNGGWFKNGDIRVEIYVDGEWRTVECEISSPYPNGDQKKDFGGNFEKYVFTLKEAVVCRGVRIIGHAGGSASFISVSELSVVSE